MTRGKWCRRAFVAWLTLALVVGMIGPVVDIAPDAAPVDTASAAQGDVNDLGVDSEIPGGVGDFDGDGDLDVLFSDTTASNNVQVVDADGNTQDTGQDAFIDVGAMGQFDGDDDVDAFYENSDLFYVDSAGNNVDAGVDVLSIGVEIADIDGDGDQDFPYGDGSQSLKIVDPVGNTIDTGVQAAGTGGVGDIDGDGDLEIAYEGDASGNLEFVDSAGNNVDLGLTANTVGAVEDFDDDGEHEIAYTDGSNNLKYVDDAGSVTDTGEQAEQAAGAGDIDGDNKIELVFEDTSTNLKTYETAGQVQQFQTLSGFVKKSDGTGINNANVTILKNGAVEKETVTASDGSWSVTVVNDTYTVEANKSNFNTNSKSVTVDGPTTGVNLTLTQSSGPYLTFAAPQNNRYEKTVPVTLEATPKDPNDLNVTVTFVVRNFSDYSWDTIKTTTVESGERATAEHDPNRGTNKWYVVLKSEDGSETNSSIFEYNAPGELLIYNGSTYTPLQDTTITVAFRSQESNFENSTTQTDDPRFFLENFPDEEMIVEVSAPGYLNTTDEINSPSFPGSVVLYPRAGSGIPKNGYYQEWTLDDRTGEFPPQESWVGLQVKVNGTWRTVTSDQFGGDNLANTTVRDGETYRILVTNEQDASGNIDTRMLGTWEADESRYENSTITLTIYDQDGDDADDVNLPPIAEFEYEPTAPITGDTIRFDAGESRDPDGSITTYQWDFDEDGRYENESEIAKWSYATSGAKRVALNVIDDDGSEDLIVYQIHIGKDAAHANEAPNASFRYSPHNPGVGVNVTFNGSQSTDGDDGIGIYEWDIDNDNVYELNGSIVNHSFAAEGKYQVTLRVKDANGSSTWDTETKLITVGDGEGIGQAGYTWDAFAQSCVTTGDDNICDEFQQNWDGTDPKIVFTFDAGSGVNVTDFNLTIYQQGKESDPIFSNNFGSVNDLVHKQPLNSSQINQTWVVEWTAFINGDEQSGIRYIGTGARQDIIPVDIDQWVIQWLAIGLLIMTALTFSQFSRGIGWVTTSMLGGFLWFIGALSGVATGGTVFAAIALSVVAKAARDTGGPT